LEEKITCHACIQPLTTSADLFARHHEKLHGNTLSFNDEDSDDECYSINNNSASSMTSDGVENQISVATNKSKKRSTPSSAIKKSKAKVSKKVSTETDGFYACLLWQKIGSRTERRQY
jgi:hypothetical protein